MNIEITKKMALTSLRPNIEAYWTLGVPSDQEIEAERERLNKHMKHDEKKFLKRQAHPVQADDLADEIEALKTQVSTQANSIAQLTAQVAALGARGK